MNPCFGLPRRWYALAAIGIVAAAGLALPLNGQQRARISEERRTLTTYPFSEPNPIPILGKDARLYPYHTFDGYAHEPTQKEWTVVHLENELIEVWVLPEVGGKVWGARVKATGHEFIYRNEVMKFRNIALRGPWTSGGIEFNFGIIGHTPATATPVDYLLRENDDGSVSCFVGTMDLPSRTSWRVEIRLPADRAYFETNALWYNPTELHQPYYNWMTGASFAQDDLELVIPGSTYLTHPGQARAWPIDDRGRDLSLYRNNDVGDNKSYHVVGELNDFFGGYYHDDDYGFGHWARHEDLPGQKQWLWASSRLGGIWEDLLTDADGQYAEFQAGRLLVQYSPDGSLTPITQASFEPHASSRWSETWFPVEGLGGLTDASREGAMALEREGGNLTVAAHAFGDFADSLLVWVEGNLTHSQPVRLRALEPFRTSVPVPDGARYRVAFPAIGLDYDSDPSERRLSRPFRTDPAVLEEIPQATRLAFQGTELADAREYARAQALFRRVVRLEPWNREARLGLARLAYRSGQYTAGLEHVNRVLQLDAYDPDANFVAGTLYRALERWADAHDAFGWAARAMGYRAAANAQLADLMLRRGDWEEAERYARLALDFDRRSFPALRALMLVGRMTDDLELADEGAQGLLAQDPLHHFVLGELMFTQGLSPAQVRDRLVLRSEFPQQTLFEVAMDYLGWGRRSEAAAVLGLIETPDPLVGAWMAWLRDDPAGLAEIDESLIRTAGDALSFTFPFRRESIDVLRWASARSDHWAWTYLLALNLWARDRDSEAAELMRSLGEVPELAEVYAARARLLASHAGVDGTPDVRRAVTLAPESRVIAIEEIQHLQATADWSAALSQAERARARFPNDFNVDLLYARALSQTGRPAEALDVLAAVRVLPSEHARDSHLLYEQAHQLMALDAIRAGDHAGARDHLDAAMVWPEHLGQGRPYAPDERLTRALLGHVARDLGEVDTARREFERVTDWGSPDGLSATRRDVLGAWALHHLGERDRLRELAGFAGGSDDALSSALARFAMSLANDAVADAVREIEAAGVLGDDVEARLITAILALP